MIEEWRPVKGFEGYYEVSNLGRVKSLPRPSSKRPHHGGIIAGGLDKDGYRRVMFRIDGHHTTRPVHRLVCEAFNGPPDILHCEVDHIDNDRANARADNLRWVSRGQNMHRDSGFDTSGERNGFARLSEEQALRIHSEAHRSYNDLAAEFGVSYHTVRDVRKGRRWKHLAPRSSQSIRVVERYL